ncbi:MAG: radical SAM protein [Eggerthellaceae bacterium]|nr:radical SAM protein [Eggerthellaceae bacterium]
MHYEGTLYRPPSEARSLIVQVTIGCAHNTCTFCDMYKDKSFRIRPLLDVLADFEEAAASPYALYFDKVFLADGDALVVKTKDLLTILSRIHELFPQIKRVSSYGTTQDILKKSEEELRQLRDAGLELVYLGAESGDDDVLTYIDKRVTSAQIIEAGKKLKRCGIDASITLISGLGGRQKVEEHAKACAHLISEIKPKYCSFLTLMLYEGTPFYDDVVSGKFERITPDEIMDEMEIFLDNVDSEGTIFRSNHASNHLALAGTLNADRDYLKQQVRQARERGAYRTYREVGDII